MRTKALLVVLFLLFATGCEMLHEFTPAQFGWVNPHDAAGTHEFVGDPGWHDSSEYPTIPNYPFNAEPYTAAAPVNSLDFAAAFIGLRFGISRHDNFNEAYLEVDADLDSAYPDFDTDDRTLWVVAEVEPTILPYSDERLPLPIDSRSRFSTDPITGELKAGWVKVGQAKFTGATPGVGLHISLDAAALKALIHKPGWWGFLNLSIITPKTSLFPLFISNPRLHLNLVTR